MKIAIIDNDILALEVLAKKLNSFNGISVSWSETSGKNALNMLFDHHKYVDAMLIDMSLEDISGVELCRSIRRRNHTVGIVAMTSFNLITYQESAIRNGAQALISKSEINSMKTALEYASQGLPYPPKSQFRNTIESYSQLQSTPESLIMLVTPREAQILNNVILGMTNKEIAEKIGVSEETIKTHLKSAMHKIGATNRVRASILWSTLKEDYFDHCE